MQRVALTYYSFVPSSLGSRSLRSTGGGVGLDAAIVGYWLPA